MAEPSVEYILEYMLQGQFITTPLSKQRMLIGRSATCDICFPDFEGVSKLHATLTFAEGGWMIADASSRNGTFVNSNRIVEHRLRDGDVITIGPVHMTYYARMVEAPVPPPAAVPEPVVDGPPAHLLSGSATRESLPVVAGDSGEMPALAAALTEDVTRTGDPPPFDPYLAWFGIGEEQRPPSLYLLVGVADFEPDPQVIHQASLQRMAVLRKYQTGRYSDLCQQLMTEVSQARVVLLDPAQKRAYDRQLRKQLRAKLPVVLLGRTLPITWAQLYTIGRATAVVTMLAALAAAVISLDWIPTAKIQEWVSLVWPASQPAPAPDKNPDGTEPPPTGETEADLLKLTNEDLVFLGFPPLAECEFESRQAVSSVCLAGFPATGIDKVEGGLAHLDVSVGDQRHLFLPVSGSHFAVLARVRLEPGAPVVALGAFESPEAAIELTLHEHESGWLAEFVTPAGKATPTPIRVTANDVWLALEGNGRKWTAYLAAMPEGSVVGDLPGKVELAKVAEANVAFQAVTAGLAIRRTKTTETATAVAVDYLRVEAAAGPQTRELGNAWPTRVPVPDSETMVKLFGGQVDFDPNDWMTVSFSPLSESHRQAWKADTLWQGAASLPAGTRFDMGALGALQALKVEVSFPRGGGAFDVEFAGGEKVRFYAADTGLTADAGDQSVLVPPAKSYTLALSNSGAASKVEVFGDSAEAARKRPLPLPAGVRLDGPIRVLVGPDEPVGLRAFELTGRYDGTRLWMASLRGEANVLTAAAARPDRVQMVIERAPPPPPPTTVLRTAPDAAPALTLAPGQPVNLAFLNTADDEEEPTLDDADKLLYFTRTPAEKDDASADAADAAAAVSTVLLGRRPNASSHFQTEERLEGLAADQERRGMAGSPRGEQVLFAQRAESGFFQLFEGSRDDRAQRLQRAELFTAATVANADVLHPTYAPDGTAVYFTVVTKPAEPARPRRGRRVPVAEPDRSVIHRCTRPTDAGLFGAPEPVGLPEGFAHASVTADNLTLYLDGPSPLGPPGTRGLYRSTRRLANAPWGEPVHLSAALHAPLGPRGSFHPNVSADGQQLYFASDRPGGQGGADLYVVAIANVPADGDTASQALVKLRRQLQGQPVAATAPKNPPPTTNPTPKPTPKPTPEMAKPDPAAAATPAVASDQWRVLGPIPRNAEAGWAKLIRDRVAGSGLQSKLPEPGEQFGGFTWGTERISKPGLYLIARSFDLEGIRTVALQVSSRPGSVVFWINKDLAVFGWDESADGAEWVPKANSVDLGPSEKRLRGKYRLLGIVCVGDPTIPLSLQLIDTEKNEPVKGVDFTDPAAAR